MYSLYSIQLSRLGLWEQHSTYSDLIELNAIEAIRLPAVLYLNKSYIHISIINNFSLNDIIYEI